MAYTAGQIRAFDPKKQQAFTRWTTAQQQGIAPQTLTPWDLASYGSRRNTANLQYSQGLAQNQFQRGQVRSQYGSNLRDLRRQFGQLRQQIPQQAVGRGLLTSGIYKQGLSDYATDRQSAVGELLRQRMAAFGGLNLGRTNLEQTRAQTLANIAAEEAARRQMLAAQIRGF